MSNQTLNDLLLLMANSIAGGALFPTHYQRSDRWLLKTPYATAANRYTIQSPKYSVVINNQLYYDGQQLAIDLSAAANWDTVTPTDYTVAATRAGKDFYVYVCEQTGTIPKIVLSAASTYPSGYTADNSRKIGGFHCLCVDVGTISGHTLTDFVAGDVLPASIYDLNHKPKWASPEGMVFSDQANIWVDIYLASGNGASTASAYGATIKDTRDWLDFTDDGAAVKKRMLRDREFQIIAAKSNEGTNITGSSDPVTTGGHIDTASRRMISDIGCEDCCGVEDQWLDEQSFRCDPDGTVIAAGLTSTIVHDNTPGGNPIYLRQASSGLYYLACNMASAAVDKYIGPTNYKIPVKHEAGAATGAIGQVYFDDDATNAWEKLLCNISTITKNVFIPTNNPAYFLEIKHDASAATNGTAVNFDDGADNRLESDNAGGANATFDLSLNSQSFTDYTLPGSKGKLNHQGTYGDVKLRAGRTWTNGSACGSRGRAAAAYRWSTSSNLGCRFCAEPV
jgi:hypothetical protein